MSDEITRRYREAFDKVQPVDEAHREKLEKMKERLLSSQERFEAGLQSVRNKTAKPVVTPETQALIHEARKLRKEGRDALKTAMAEQAELIRRIRLSSQRTG